MASHIMLDIGTLDVTWSSLSNNEARIGYRIMVACSLYDKYVESTIRSESPPKARTETGHY